MSAQTARRAGRTLAQLDCQADAKRPHRIGVVTRRPDGQFDVEMQGGVRWHATGSTLVVDCLKHHASGVVTLDVLASEASRSSGRPHVAVIRKPIRD